MYVSQHDDRCVETLPSVSSVISQIFIQKSDNLSLILGGTLGRNKEIRKTQAQTSKTVVTVGS